MERGAGGELPVPEYLGGVSMKKLISILVVFGLLTAAVFAQDGGTWSVGSSGNIGTSLNFIPMERNEGGHATTHLEGYDYRGAGDMRGNFDLTYKIGGLSAGFGINQQDGVSAKVSFNGEGFQFNAEQDIRYLLNNTGGHRNSLWGNYTFPVLNGIKLEAAVSRTGEQTWSTTGVFDDTFTHTEWGGDQFGVKTYNINPIVTTGETAGSDDDLWRFQNANYLKLDVSPIAGLNLGFMIPNVFVDPATDFLTNALQYTVFGARYADGPLGIALQFALKGQVTSKFETGKETTDPDIKSTLKDGDLYTGLYAGVSYRINDQISAGVEFRGIFGDQGIDKDGKWQDAAVLRFGATLSYSDGPFGASLRFRFYEPNTVVDHDQSFRIRPMLWYTVVEGYLQARVRCELTFLETVKEYDNEGKPVYENVMGYNFQPEIFFNFLGTGVGNDPQSVGITVAYYVAGPRSDGSWNGYFEPEKGQNSTNKLEIMFGWSF